MDWGTGYYEHVAPQIMAASRVVVGACAPSDRVLDVGCGTGNATGLLARQGRRVVALDPARRLLGVTQTTFARAGLAVRCVAGVAEAIPLTDQSFDVIVSVFGAVFSTSPDDVAAELDRVLGAHGQIVMTAWLPAGAISAQARIRREAVAAALGQGAQPPVFAWHDRDALRELFGPFGFRVEVGAESLPFTAASVDEYVTGELTHHPAWVDARAVLEPLGQWETIRDRVITLFASANESETAFQVTSDYVVITATR